MAARVIDQNPAHHPRRNAEEVSPISPVGVSLVGQTQVQLVNERGRLQRRGTSVTAKLACGNATQLRVHERHQLIQSIGVTASPFSKKRRHVGSGRHVDSQIVERCAFSIEARLAFSQLIGALAWPERLFRPMFGGSLSLLDSLCG